MNSSIINLKKIPSLKYLEFPLDTPINLLLDKLMIGESLKLKFILHQQIILELIISFIFPKVE